jgi:hypothetical protein
MTILTVFVISLATYVVGSLIAASLRDQAGV